MHTISINQLKKVIEHTVVGLNEPIIVIGSAGSGKTAGTYEAAKELGYYLEPDLDRGYTGSGVTLLGQYDTVDLKGTPWLAKLGDTDFKATVWHPAATLPFVGNPAFPDDEDEPILLFFDEITSATVPVLGICYQLIHERRVGEHVLKPNVRIICAGNREQDKGIVNRMPMPLCNRLTWFEIGIDVEAWCTWAQKKYGREGDIFAAFMNFRKPLINTYDPKKPEKTFATPRTWEKALRYYHSKMPADIKMACMAGAVGDGPAAEFWAFVDVWHKIAKIMPQILKDPEHAPLVTELSMQYAVAVSISGSITEKNAMAYHTYLCRMDPEYVILAWQLAVARLKSLFTCPAFLDFTKKFKVAWS